MDWATRIPPTGNGSSAQRDREQAALAFSIRKSNHEVTKFIKMWVGTLGHIWDEQDVEAEYEDVGLEISLVGGKCYQYKHSPVVDDDGTRYRTCYCLGLHEDFSIAFHSMLWKDEDPQTRSNSLIEILVRLVEVGAMFRGRSNEGYPKQKGWPSGKPMPVRRPIHVFGA